MMMMMLMIIGPHSSMYVNSLVRRISKIKCHPLPQEPPVWTNFLTLDANKTLPFLIIILVYAEIFSVCFFCCGQELYECYNSLLSLQNNGRYGGDGQSGD